MAALRRFSPALVRFLPAGALVLSFVLTFSLYGSALSLGFAFDDPFDLPWSLGHSLADILTTSLNYSYYRPLPYLLWRPLILLLGGFDAPALHLVNLLAHAANGWLVFLLGGRLAGRGFGVLGLLLFLVFPSSYQAVLYINAVFHPLVTFFILSALLLYWEFRIRGQGWLLGASLLLAAGALFTHEYGVATAPLVLGLELYFWREHPGTGPSPWPAAYFGAAAAFFVVWRAVPKWGGPLAFPIESWGQNGLFLAQGLAWPVTRQLGSVAALMETGLEWKLGLVIAACLTIMGGLYWWRGRLRLFGLGLLWFVVAVAPAWATLPFSYMIDGNRLLYLAAVGISWLWAGLWLLGPQNRWGHLVWRGATLLGMGALLWQSAQFIDLRRQMYAQGTELTRELARATAGQGDSLLVVNFPSWFAPKQAEFPYGHSGVTVVPFYLGLGRAIYLERGDEPTVDSLGYEDLLQPQLFHFGLHGSSTNLETIAEATRRAEAIFLVEYGDNRLQVVEAGRRWLPNQGDRGYLADFSGKFRLTGAKVARQGRWLRLSLSWGIVESDDADYTVFAHLYDESGHLLAQADGYPLRGLFPLRLARPGEAWKEWRDIPMGTDLPPGRYQVAVGIYDRQDGHRLAAQDLSGQPWPDGAVTIASLSLP